MAPVATSTTRSCDVSYCMSASGARLPSTTIDLPSGVQSMDAALRSSPAPTLHLPVVSWRAVPPSAGTTKRCVNPSSRYPT